MIDLEGQIEQLQQSNDSLNRKIRRQTGQLKCLDNENKALKETNKRLDGKVKSLTKELDNAQKDKRKETATLLDQVNTLQQKNDKQRVELRDHHSLLKLEKDATDKLKNQNKELLEQTDALKGINTEQGQCIAALNKRVSQLNNDTRVTVTDLRRQLDITNVSLSKEQTQNDSNCSQKTGLEYNR